MHRRDVLTGFGGVAAAAAAATLGGEPPVSAWQGGLPRQHDFVIEDGCTYINAAYTHPIPKVALEAVRRAAAGRHTLKAPGGDSTTPPTATSARSSPS